MKRLAIRLRWQTTPAKSLVISRRGERSEGGEAERTNHYASFTLNGSLPSSNDKTLSVDDFCNVTALQYPPPMLSH